MKKNGFLLLISALALTLSIVLMIILGFKTDPDNQTVFALYLVAKIIYTLALVAVALLVFFKQMARGHLLFVYSATIAVQFIPLLMRVGYSLDNFKVGFAVIVLIVSLLLYVGWIGIVYYSNKHHLAADNNVKYEAERIEVVSQKESEERNKK